MTPFQIIAGFIALVVVITLFRTARVVPQQQVFVVERLGRYHDSLKAGFHLLVPFVDRIAYRHSLKERAIDVPQQVCITRDNVQISVDGVLYIQVVDGRRASYGIGDYTFAIAQLAQTTLRSEIGKIDLDRTFEERSTINACVVEAVDRASDPWGVKVLRYEIRDIAPPSDVLSAMEKQMRAEREKRATILASEADRDSQINRAEGEKQRSCGNRKPSVSGRSTRRKARRRPSSRWPQPPPRGFARWEKPSPAPAGRNPPASGWPSSTCPNSASSRGPRTPSFSPPTSRISAVSSLPRWKSSRVRGSRRRIRSAGVSPEDPIATMFVAIVMNRSEGSAGLQTGIARKRETRTDDAAARFE